MNEPHILSVFRTAKNPVNLKFVAQDSKGIVADQRQGVALQGHVRRLRESNETRPCTGACEDRRLYSMRRRMTSGASSIRRRNTGVNVNPMSWFSPRRRLATAGYVAGGAAAGGAAAAASVRRRGTSTNPYATSNPYGASNPYGVSSMRRRRTMGYSPGYGGSYSNPYSSSIGSYGYPSSTYAAQSFGGHIPMSVPYGYTGANAYSGSSGTEIALAAGAGLLAGYAGSHLLHHHHHWYGYSQSDMYNMRCTSGPERFRGHLNHLKAC